MHLAQKKIREIPFKRNKKYFTGRVTEDWHGVYREIVSPPSVVMFKTQLDAVLGNRL